MSNIQPFSRYTLFKIDNFRKKENFISLFVKHLLLVSLMTVSQKNCRKQSCRALNLLQLYVICIYLYIHTLLLFNFLTGSKVQRFVTIITFIKLLRIIFHKKLSIKVIEAFIFITDVYVVIYIK